ncbi:MAG: formate/nitrite transporter family protein [Planctomycetes bacterium]|nr:formate/nitrite transporter family protein [Planctomycetota bacterium]
MYLSNVIAMSELAKKKVDFLDSAKLSYIVSSMLAGAYVGIGIILIFSIGAPFAAEKSLFLKPIMGISFGIALTLVVFAGSELFTGNNMIMTLGCLRKETSWYSAFRIWGFSWLGNLAGSVLLAYIVVASGAMDGAMDFVEKVAAAKMNMPPGQMILRGILCNWLVCLALWMSGRVKSDVAKCILIFWCLFAFIASGFEHSIANMTLLSISLFFPHGDAVSFAGFVNNLTWVTLGNIIGGGIFVGGMYWLATYKEKE